MKMQKATEKKIENFKNMIANRLYTYDDLMTLMEGRKDIPSWSTLRKYNIIEVKKTENYTTEMEDKDEALLWNGWYEWNEKSGKWIIDHNFNLYGLA